MSSSPPASDRGDEVAATNDFKCPQPSGESVAARDKPDRRRSGIPQEGQTDALPAGVQAGPTPSHSTGVGHQPSAARPRLLDLFCGAGGAAMGYHRAGFDVVGVDIAPQPHYPFAFVQADALDYLHRVTNYANPGFVAIHASPPCQAYTRAGALRTVKIDHPDLIGPTRELLQATGLPYVIENVPGAPLFGAVQLCGTAFGLGGPDWDLQRHRLFECSFPLRATGCFHEKPAISVVGHGATKATRERLGRNPKIAEKRAAMGIDWMNRDELSEAIPPVYTEYVGNWLLGHIREKVAA